MVYRYARTADEPANEPRRMTSLSGSHVAKATARREEREAAERSISVQAEVIALKRKAAGWGASEDQETIGSLTGRWEALCNWFTATVYHKGKSYPSVEHAFQAAKAGDDSVAAEAIRVARTPKEAHALGRALPLPSDWERRKLALMRQLLRDKFRRDPALRERLLRTESKNLIAGNDYGEVTWGVSGGRGSNELGKALMALRDEAQRGTDVDVWLQDQFQLAPAAEVPAHLSLEVRKAGAVSETIELGVQSLVIIGKHSSSTIQLEHPSISRRHGAILRHADGRLLLVDLASKVSRPCLNSSSDLLQRRLTSLAELMSCLASPPLPSCAASPHLPCRADEPPRLTLRCLGGRRRAFSSTGGR